MKIPIQKKLVYFGMELSIYLIDKTRIVKSQKNGPLRSFCLLITKVGSIATDKILFSIPHMPSIET